MKITVEWEDSDIKVGNYYYRNESNAEVSTDLPYFLSVLWKIGYVSEKSSNERYCSISMTDGLVIMQFSNTEFAKTLSENGYIPCEGVQLETLLIYAASQYGN